MGSPIQYGMLMDVTFRKRVLSSPQEKTEHGKSKNPTGREEKEVGIQQGDEKNKKPSKTHHLVGRAFCCCDRDRRGGKERGRDKQSTGGSDPPPSCHRKKKERQKKGHRYLVGYKYEGRRNISHHVNLFFCVSISRSKTFQVVEFFRNYDLFPPTCRHRDSEASKPRLSFSRSHCSQNRVTRRTSATAKARAWGQPERTSEGEARGFTTSRRIAHVVSRGTLLPRRRNTKGRSERMMAAVGSVASVAARQAEAASCSGIGHGGGGVAGCHAVAAGSSWGVKRVGGGAAHPSSYRGRKSAKGGSTAPLRWGWAVAAMGSSTFGGGASATPAGASRQQRSKGNMRRGERGLGLVTDAVAMNRSTKSIDEMDPEHVTFASQDELDHG